jgi:hypothetical protein
MEKRNSARVDASLEMNGKLLNVVSFAVNNISGDGINLVSNFQPATGGTYKIYLMNNRDGGQQEFDVEITRSEVTAFDSEKYASLPPGLLFSIGARFVNPDERQREFLASFMNKKSAGLDEGFIRKNKIEKNS